MLSAGNDIVVFSEIDVARTNTPQFYTKILSEPEIALYERFSANILFEHYVWLLWSIKESAYKFLKRIHSEIVFTPVKFEIKHLRISAEYGSVNFTGKEVTLPLTGNVQFDIYTLYSKSFIERELISSVVDSDERFDDVYSNNKKINSVNTDIQSAEVRIFLIGELKRLTGKSDLTIKKNAKNIPVLFNGQEELPIPISLSHHGRYIAYCFNLKKKQKYFRKVLRN
jgi:phosphopantetheinyl transferase (holo-ACP synthase)